MGLSNCPECGKLYLENARKLCPDCSRIYDEHVETVLEYLKTVSKATISEIGKATGVKTSIIIKLMNKGYFSSSHCQISYPCERCGKPIEQGRLCEKCNKTLYGENAQPEYKAPETKFSKKGTSKWHMQ